MTGRREEIKLRYKETHGKSGGGQTDEKYDVTDYRRLIEDLTNEMRASAKRLEFERAAYLRDKIKELDNLSKRDKE
jgi:excinuclease ABC subunit B